MPATDFPPDLFADPRSGERHLRAVHEHFISSGSRFSLDDFSRVFTTALRASPDPDMALANFLRFLEVTVSPASLCTDLLQYPLLLDVLMTVFGNSRYFSDILVRDPSLFRWLTASSVLREPATRLPLEEEIERILNAFAAPERRLDAIRRMFRRELLRIGVQDTLALADLRSVTGQLSLLADAVIDAVVRVALDQVSEKLRLLPGTGFAVIGLGKLGGNELNYSSDVDLLFVYGEEGTGPDGGPSFHEFFNVLGERIVQNLARSSKQGHLFRVDMRLRPESGAGPLARSIESHLLYYEARGELWERQMLLKARPVAGDLALGRQFIASLEPFVHPRSFLEHPAESVARIKARIETSIGDAANVKLMAGGIRDIEFIVQTLQLLNAGKNPSLRSGNTLQGLELLAEGGLLTPKETKDLGQAYIFYRTLEHRLQTMHNTQTHTLPKDTRATGLLARRLGLPSAAVFGEEMAKHLRNVRAIFSRVFTVPPDSSAADLEAVIDGASPEEATRRLLQDYGFRDVRQALKSLRVLALGSTLTGARETGARERSAFRSVALPLFDELSATPDPDLTLHCLALIAGGQNMPGAFFAELRDQHFRKFLLQICSFSPRFSRALAVHPELLEALAGDIGALERAAADGLPAAGDALEFKMQQELRTGIRHLLGFSTFDEMTAEHAAIADFIVAGVFDGILPGGARRPRLALFAAGKYGSREAILDADLDLFFVADVRGAAQRAALEARAAEIVRALSMVSPKGRLYEVDVRLRPEGRNAPLVTDRSAYGKYLRERASLWERQMLTRLRFVCGDPAVGRAVLEEVGRFIRETPLPPDWVASIVAMRRKMESRTRTRGEAIVDLKLGPGGMADIEFLAQMCVLKPGCLPPSHRGGTVLNVLAAAGPAVLTPDELSRLQNAYRLYRRLEWLLRITLDERGACLPVEKNLETLARCHGRKSGRDLADLAGRTMREVRVIFLRSAARIGEGGAA
jgi:glutamate-ammonia-ligase adenylyltransferase